MPAPGESRQEPVGQHDSDRLDFDRREYGLSELIEENSVRENFVDASRNALPEGRAKAATE